MSDSVPSARKEVIARRLLAGHAVQSSALASEFSVSEDAIRRDLRMLADEGICRRVYGGALDISPQTLRDIHLPLFKAAIDAGAITIMSAFNDINGVPASANRHLMTTILRDEWAFQGFVVSDYTSDMELIAHGYAADERDAARLAFVAGVDMSPQSGFYAMHLEGLVSTGEVPAEVLDEGVRRVLSVKKAIGLFAIRTAALNQPGRPIIRGWHPMTHWRAMPPGVRSCS